MSLSTRKQTEQRRHRNPRPPLLATPLQIEVTNEEILADLRYPAPSSRRRRV